MLLSYCLSSSPPQSQQLHPQTEPKKLTLDVDIPVCPPRTGVKSASGVRGLGAEEDVALEIRIGVATRTRTRGFWFLI